MSIPSSQFTPPCLFSSCNHQCVFYICDCFVNRFISILLLDSTYKHYHVVSVFLCLTSLSMTISRYIRVTAMTSFHSFNGWVIVHCAHVPYMLHPFLWCWTFRLPTCPGYCKQHSNEYCGAFIFFKNHFYLSMVALQCCVGFHCMAKWIS